METKICHMTSAHNSLDVRIFEKECRSLSKAGFDTYLVAQGKSFEKGGVKICGTNKMYSSRLKRMFFSSRDVYSRAVEIDATIYHIHDPELLPYALKLKKRGKIVVFDSHEDLPRQILSKDYIWKPFRTLVSVLTEKYEGYVLKRLDCVVTATPHIAEMLKLYNPNIVVIHNYPILDDYKECNEPKVREKAVCYTGGISLQNGIFSIVTAMRWVDGKLYLAGDMPKILEEELKKDKGWSNVIKLGHLSREEVRKLQNKCTCGVVLYLPSGNTVDAMPNKMFEYMAAGLPVIASDFPLWRELIEDNECGFCVDPKDPSQIAVAINKIFSDADMAKRMGENGKKAVCEKYNWGGGKTEFDFALPKTDKRRLCYCGGITEKRGITQIVRALDKIDAELLLAGNMSMSYQQTLMELPGWKKVKYLGVLNREQVSLMYQKSAIGLCVLQDTPNIYYSLPIKMFEYMAAGLPVICSNFPLWKEIIEDNKCGICVDPMNAEMIADSIENLLNSKKELSLMGENGKKAVERSYTWIIEEKKLIALYHKLESRRFV